MFLKILNQTPFNLSTTKKICFSGIMIVLVMLFNKVFAVNYIALIPFVRISFGSIALIVFSSIAFGPLYGMIIGISADILGYFIFDASAFGWFPQITLTYALLGLVPYFIYLLVRSLKNKNLMMVVEYVVFGVILIGLSVFFALNKSLTLYGQTYSFELYQRILIPSVTALLVIVTIITNLILDKKMNTDELPFNVYQLSFIIFLCEIFINFLFGSLMKAWAFGFNMFLAILISQGVIMFFNIPYNCYLIFVIMKLFKRQLVN